MSTFNIIFEDSNIDKMYEIGYIVLFFEKHEYPEISNELTQLYAKLKEKNPNVDEDFLKAKVMERINDYDQIDFVFVKKGYEYLVDVDYENCFGEPFLKIKEHAYSFIDNILKQKISDSDKLRRIEEFYSIDKNKILVMRKNVSNFLNSSEIE